MEPMATTKNQHGQKIAEELTHCLADTYALYLKTQNFHWNVTGEEFYMFHKMFEAQYQELADALDEIAERIRSIGFYTPASFSQYMQLSSIEEEKNIVPSKEMVKKLLQDHEMMVQNISEMIPKAQKAHDEGTADLLIQRLKAHEKTAWMLKSSLR